MTELATLYSLLLRYGKYHPLRFLKQEKQTMGESLISLQASFITRDCCAKFQDPMTCHMMPVVMNDQLVRKQALNGVITMHGRLDLLAQRLPLRYFLN